MGVLVWPLLLQTDENAGGLQTKKNKAETIFKRLVKEKKIMKNRNNIYSNETRNRVGDKNSDGTVEKWKGLATRKSGAFLLTNFNGVQRSSPRPHFQSCFRYHLSELHAGAL